MRLDHTRPGPREQASPMQVEGTRAAPRHGSQGPWAGTVGVKLELTNAQAEPRERLRVRLARAVREGQA